MKSIIDLRSRMGNNRVRKVLTEILKSRPNNIVITSHCKKELKNDDLIVNDLINVLHKGMIYQDPEFEHGSWRYRVETNKITVIITFEKPQKIICVTTWRN